MTAGVLADFEIENLCCDERHIKSTWIHPISGIEQEIPNPGPLVEPFIPEHLGPVTLDLTLGTSFFSHTEFSAYTIKDGVEDYFLGNNLTILEPNMLYGGEGFKLTLQPKQFLTCVSQEHFKLPPDILGEIFVKSSRAREGLDHSNATVINPGFHGDLTFEIRNEKSEPYEIWTGMRILHIKFIRLKSAVRTPYFLQSKAIYQDQKVELFSRDSR